MAFGNLVRRLDNMYEKRGIRIKLFEWEDYDSAYNDTRKQDEYNDYVRQSDIFLALFHKKAGQFTVEEFNIASQEFKDHASPKVYTYCKDLKPGEEETPELKEFKEHLFNEMGHYWCRYDNRESFVYNRLGNNDTALWHYMKGYQIALDVMGQNSSNTTHFFSNIAWTYHLMGKYDDALIWAEKAVIAYPSQPHIIDTLASVFQDLERFDDALEQFEHCLKLQKEQNASERSIRATEEKIAKLKELIKNGVIS